MRNPLHSAARAGWLAATLTTVGAAAAIAEPARVTLRQDLGDPPAPGNEPVASTVIGRGGLNGETLSFHLGVAYECSSEDGRRQLLVTIADTARFTDATGIPSPQVMKVNVPLRQLQWLQPAKICRELPAAQAPAEGDSVRYFRLRSRATAFATLTCAGEGGQQEVAMATAPLDVWLGCDPPEPESRGPEGAGLTAPEPGSPGEK